MEPDSSPSRHRRRLVQTFLLLVWWVRGSELLLVSDVWWLLWKRVGESEKGDGDGQEVESWSHAGSRQSCPRQPGNDMGCLRLAVAPRLRTRHALSRVCSDDHVTDVSQQRLNIIIHLSPFASLRILST